MSRAITMQTIIYFNYMVLTSYTIYISSNTVYSFILTNNSTIPYIYNLYVTLTLEQYC